MCVCCGWRGHLFQNKSLNIQEHNTTLLPVKTQCTACLCNMSFLLLSLFVFLWEIIIYPNNINVIHLHTTHSLSLFYFFHAFMSKCLLPRSRQIWTSRRHLRWFFTDGCLWPPQGHALVSHTSIIQTPWTPFPRTPSSRMPLPHAPPPLCSFLSLCPCICVLAFWFRPGLFLWLWLRTALVLLKPFSFNICKHVVSHHRLTLSSSTVDRCMMESCDIA